MTTTDKRPDQWPTEPHPFTGETFTGGSLEWVNESYDVRYLPPPKPQQTWLEEDWDGEDEYLYECSMSDEEYADALQHWERAMAEWQRTCGTHRVQGPLYLKGSFTTDSGSTVEGWHDGKGWHWTTVEARNACPGGTEA